MTQIRPIVFAIVLAVLTSAALTLPPRAAVPDRGPPAPRAWPMFGGSPARNMVNLFDKNLPATWAVEEGKQKNIKWTADLGRQTFGSPVIANGSVFVSTNGHKGNNAVLMALRERDGKLLWQNTHPHPKDFGGGFLQGVASTAAVDGSCVYYLVPGCEVICADCDTGNIDWRYDMVQELKVYPSPGIACQYPPLAAPLVVGELIYVATSNGIDCKDELVAPKAPSFVALDKRTGKLAWQSNLPGQNIFVGGWSSPAYANVNNVPQVIFAGGDSVIYSFAPLTGELLWQCDCLPLRAKKQKHTFDNFFVGTPVVVGDKLYIGLGAPDFTPGVPKASYFLCLDITKKGDVSLKSYDAKAEANKNSALVWAFGGPIVPTPNKGRRVFFHSTISTAAVHDGLVYIPERTGYLHCLDAATGREVWVHDFKAEVFGSPYWVDGRVFVGTGDDEIIIFAHGRTAKVLAAIDFDELVYTTPAAANGVLYVMTGSRLYAMAREK
jgi:outer membrane protein assembly factor BamB